MACVLKAILMCQGNDRLQIIIHDFWNREKYHVLLKYLEETDRAETLGVFTIKKDIDLDAINADYSAYQYISD